MAILRVVEEETLEIFFAILLTTLMSLCAYSKILRTYCMHKRRKVVRRGQIGLFVVSGKLSKMLVLLIFIWRDTLSRGSKA